MVFDGSKAWNREDDPAEPILAYGRTKREAEPHVLACPGGLVARLSLLYGPSRCGRPAFFDRTMDALRRGEPRAFFEDEFRTPLDLATAAATLASLAATDAVGTVHVAGAERVSRFELVRRAAIALGIDPSARPRQPPRRRHLGRAPARRPLARHDAPRGPPAGPAKADDRTRHLPLKIGPCLGQSPGNDPEATP